MRQKMSDHRVRGMMIASEHASRLKVNHDELVDMNDQHHDYD